MVVRPVVESVRSIRSLVLLREEAALAIGNCTRLLIDNGLKQLKVIDIWLDSGVEVVLIVVWLWSLHPEL